MNFDSGPAPDGALVAVDLGAESCRVSLLRWHDGQPVITLVHRFANAPYQRDGHLYWDLAAIQNGVEHGLCLCAGIATEGIASVGVDGWAVDYVRVDGNGKALADPFCYRDHRTIRAEEQLHRLISAERLRQLTGIQLLRINTLYQLFADADGFNGPWLNLPEYLLSRWGGDAVAEYTNATHTQMLGIGSMEWVREIFDAAGFALAKAPAVVPPGTDIGRLTCGLAELPAFRETRLIAPACHDTASAIAGIPATGTDWAYISSGTWSLVGTLLEQPRNDASTARENFANLGAVGGRTCFHKNVNGMWLIKQCMETWATAGRAWNIAELVRAAEAFEKSHDAPQDLLEVDASSLLLTGNMPELINAQRSALGLRPLDTTPENAPQFAHLIFHSLAARYAEVLRKVEEHSGKHLKRLFVVGGANRNALLNRLTAQATGLELICGSPESSTIGNFAVQLAALTGQRDPVSGAHGDQVSRWAERLCAAQSTTFG
jgi:rhamnulokinase